MTHPIPIFTLLIHAICQLNNEVCETIDEIQHTYCQEKTYTQQLSDLIASFGKEDAVMIKETYN